MFLKKINKLKQIIISQNFNPTFLGVFVNPFYFARKGLYYHIKQLAVFISGKTLDIGCGSKPYETLFVNATDYIGLEVDSPKNRGSNADFFYDGKVFPFEHESFDSIISNQVFEHVFNPIEFLKEINRVLKVGGILLMTVPFIWDEHEQPYDFARYSSFGLKYLLEQNGFKIIEQRKSISDIRIIFQLLNAYLYKTIKTQNSLLNLLICVLLMSPFNIIGEILFRLLPINADLYLDNIVLARKDY